MSLDERKYLETDLEPERGQINTANLAAGDTRRRVLEDTLKPKETAEKRSAEAIKFVNCVFRGFKKPYTQVAAELPQRELDIWKDRTMAACMAVWIGAKPAAFVEKLTDEGAGGIQEFLDKNGKNAAVYQNSFIYDRDLVAQRIKEEPTFAEELGWEEGMTIDSWLGQANPNGNGRERGIIGFFLGYPQSAIEAYKNRQIKSPVLVEIGNVFFFATDASLAEAEDIEQLNQRTRRAFEEAGLEKFFHKKSDSEHLS